MPRVRVRNEIVNFPDSMSGEEIDAALAEMFPANGDEITQRIAEDPNFVPDPNEFKTFYDHGKDKDVDWLSTFGSGMAMAGNILGKAVKAGVMEGAALNPANYVEGMAQGTRGLAGMVTESPDPHSWAFRFKNWLNDGGDDMESKRQQFIEARKFAADTLRLEEGKDTLIMPEGTTNPAFTTGASMVMDPSLIVPGAFAGKIANKAMGLGVRTLGRGLNMVAKPIERGVGRLGVAVEELAGMSPGQIRNTLTTYGAGGAVAGLPGAGTALAAANAIPIVRGVGDVLEGAGRNLMDMPSRIGPMEALGLAPNAPKLHKLIGAVGKAGGDRALDTGLKVGAGAGLGSGIGGTLGWWSGGEEGALSGAGFGSVLGAAGAGVGGVIEGVSGKARREARAADLKRFVERHSPEDQERIGRVIKRDGIDETIQMLDGAKSIAGPLQDFRVEWLTDQEFITRTGGSARGMFAGEKDGQPYLAINVDRAHTGKTLFHEMFHALQSVEQLSPQMDMLRKQVIGEYDSTGKKIKEGEWTDAQITKVFETYKNKRLNVYDTDGKLVEEKKYTKQQKEFTDAVKKEYSQLTTDGQKAYHAFGEGGAEYLSKLISGADPDAMLRGFGGAKSAIIDRVTHRFADTMVGRMINRLAGNNKVTDSITFGGDLPNASPTVNRMLRDLVRARTKMKEKVGFDEETMQSFNRGDAIPAELARDLQNSVFPTVEPNPDGTVSLRSDAALNADRTKFNAAMDAVANIPVADPSKPHLRVVDGLAEGNGFSPEQMAHIAQNGAAMGMPDKVQEMLPILNQSMTEGNVVDNVYGTSSGKKPTGRRNAKGDPIYDTVYKTVKVGALRQLLYRVFQNSNKDWLYSALNVTRFEDRARAHAEKGRLGPYKTDYDGFRQDFVNYLANLSDVAPTRTVDYFKNLGDSETLAKEKAAYLHQFLLKENRGKKLVGDYRMDRLVKVSPTTEKIKYNERAWAMAKVNFMPDEMIGDQTVKSSDAGYRIIQRPGGKHRLYKPNGSPAGIFDTQKQAEAMANKSYTGIPRYFMPDGPAGRHGHDEKVRGVAAEYMRGMGRAYDPDNKYSEVPVDLAKRIADHYEAVESTPNHPDTQQAYKAFADETLAQYEAMRKAGVRIEPWMKEGQPYKNSAEMIADVQQNKHMYFFPTERGFGAPDASLDRSNPLLAPTPHTINGHRLVVNDIFRAVHDYFGHVKEGNQFGPRGEFNAWKNHNDMYTEAAQPALASESLAQNSWVNFGPQMRDAAGNIRTDVPLAERAYADQKVTPLPRHFIEAARRAMPDSPADARGPAIREETRSGSRIMAAPLRSQNIDNFQPKHFKTYKYNQLGDAREAIADALGVQVENLTETFGGWDDTDTKIHSKETSSRFDVPTEHGETFKGLIGILAPEVQNSVLRLDYDNPDKTGYDASFRMKSVDAAEALAKELTNYGFHNYSYDPKLKEFNLIVKPDDHPAFKRLLSENQQNVVRESAKQIQVHVDDRGSDHYRGLVEAGLQRDPQNRKLADLAAKAFEKLDEWEAGNKLAKQAKEVLKTIPPPNRSVAPILQAGAMGKGPKIKGTGKKGEITVADVGEYFQKEARRRGILDEENPRTKKKLVDALTHEVVYQLSQNGQAVGWYDREVKKAVSIMQSIHPELATDKKAEFIFKLMLAAASQGETVIKNFQNAEKYYRRYKETGEIPYAEITGGGKSIKATRANFKKIHTMLNEMGYEGLRDFMMEKRSVRDLRKMGFKVNGDLVDHVTTGAAIFGPKIGSFFRNLFGDFTPLTMDLWFSRTLNRMTGKLKRSLDDPLVKGQIDRVRRALPEDLGGQWDRKKLLADDEYLWDYANEVRADFSKGGFKDKTELNMAANRLDSYYKKLIEAPASGSQRKYWRELIDGVQAKLVEHGLPKMEIADIQAVLWYSEKDLYQMLGPSKKNTEKLSYVDGAREAGRGRVPVTTMFMPDAAMPGAVTANGFRIIPGQRGNFRVYAPSGALLGIAAGQDKARRMVQRQMARQ